MKTLKRKLILCSIAALGLAATVAHAEESGTNQSTNLSTIRTTVDAAIGAACTKVPELKDYSFDFAHAVHKNDPEGVKAGAYKLACLTRRANHEPKNVAVLDCARSTVIGVAVPLGMVQDADEDNAEVRQYEDGLKTVEAVISASSQYSEDEICKLAGL
jgi:hypothetical protein